MKISEDSGESFAYIQMLRDLDYKIQFALTADFLLSASKMLKRSDYKKGPVD